MQGVAEVVPVSSSAQLELLPFLLGWPAAPDRTTFAAGLHAGSCLGIAVALRGDLARLGRRDLMVLAATTVPAGLAGVLVEDAVDARLGRPGPTAALLAAAGVLLWVADRRPVTTPVVGRGDAAAAALAQLAALAPGVSRSGATLTALRLRGVDRPAAARFSLLMSLPVTAGAAAWTVARGDRATTLRSLRVGAPVAAVSAAAVTRALDRRGGAPVGGAALYRLSVAAAVAGRLAHARRAGRRKGLS